MKKSFKTLFKSLFAITLITVLTSSTAHLSYAEESKDTDSTKWSDLYVQDSSYTISGNSIFASESDSIYSNVYHVQNADQLISVLCASDTYPKIILDNDIDLSGARNNSWNVNRSFSGIIDGQNHTISNLKLYYSDFLFQIDELSIIENVNFELCTADVPGAIIYKNNGLITNVHVTVTDNMTYSGYDSSALTKYNYGTISDCSVNGNIKAEASHCFATIAVKNEGNISDCIFNGSIKSQNKVSTTFAMVGECTENSHTARLICNCDPQDSVLNDVVKGASSEGGDIDYTTIYYPAALNLSNTESQCTSISSIADVTNVQAFDFNSIYRSTSEPVHFTFDKEYLRSFNDQLSTTDNLTLNIHGDQYTAKIYKNLKLISFEAPLLIDTSDVDAKYSITGTLDQSDIKLERSSADIRDYKLWRDLTVGNTRYKIFYEAKAGKTYFVDLNFKNIAKYVSIPDNALDKNKKMRVAFSFGEDPGEITASNIVARWFSDNLELKPNKMLVFLNSESPLTYRVDMTYNGQSYPVVIILTVPNIKKADWTAELGPVPQWGIDYAMKRYEELTKPEDRQEVTDDDLIRGIYCGQPPVSYINFSNNHDDTIIENKINQGVLLCGILGVIDDTQYAYKLTTACDSTSLDNGKCLVSYNTSMDVVNLESDGSEQDEYLEQYDIKNVEVGSEEWNYLFNIKAETTVSTESNLNSYSIKVKSNTKGQTAAGTYEYIIESGSLSSDGKETRKAVAQKKLSSSDTYALLNMIEVSFADLLDKNTKTFKDQKTIKYYVRQLPGKDKDIRYDTSEYTIEISVKATDRGLQTFTSDAKDIKVYKNGVLTSLTPEELSFENVYDPAKDSKTDNITPGKSSTTSDDKVNPGKTSTEENVSSLKKPAEVKVTAKKKALQVTWKKVNGAAYYQVQVSTKKSFKGAKLQKKKLKKGSKAKKISYKCKKLKEKTRYFVRIRAVDSNGKPGPWSKAVKKKTK